MPAYDDRLFDLPAPVALVTLRNESSGEEQAGVPFLLDTGASATLIPAHVAQALNLEPTGKTYELSGFDGQSSQSEVVHVALIFDGLTFRGQFLTSNQEYGILGRNVLNQVSVLFDGPSLAWQRSKPS